MISDRRREVELLSVRFLGRTGAGCGVNAKACHAPILARTHDVVQGVRRRLGPCPAPRPPARVDALTRESGGAALAGAIVDANRAVAYFNYVNCIAEGLGVELEPDRVDAAGASAQMTP